MAQYVKDNKSALDQWKNTEDYKIFANESSSFVVDSEGRTRIPSTFPWHPTVCRWLIDLTEELTTLRDEVRQDRAEFHRKISELSAENIRISTALAEKLLENDEDFQSNEQGFARIDALRAKIEKSVFPGVFP
jgi:hypothetical protein